MKEFISSTFLSLPVVDLAKSIIFYSSIGFNHKEMFPDNSAAWMTLNDFFSVMLITQKKWKEFTTREIPNAKKSAQFGLSIMQPCKSNIENLIIKGIKAGGTSDPNPIEEFDFMYGRSIEDPDGHIIEFKWIDNNAFKSS